MQHLEVADLGILQTHLTSHLESRLMGDVLASGDGELHQDHAVTGPFGLRTQLRAVPVGAGALQTHADGVGGVQLVNIDDLLRHAQGAAVNEVAGLVQPLGQVVGAEVVTDWRQVVRVTFDDGAGGHAALTITGDAVVVALGELG